MGDVLKQYLILFICMLAGSVWADSDGSLELSAEERSYLKGLPPLSLGADEYWPPLGFFEEDGTYRGINADYSRLIAEKLGLELLPFHSSSWEQLVKDFRAGKMDLISGVQPTPSRLEYMEFSKPFLDRPYMIMVHEDARFVNSLADLQGKRVAVGSGFAIEELLSNDYPELNLVGFSSGGEALEALSTGDVDAYIGLLDTSTWLLQNLNISNVKVTAPTQYKYFQSIGINKKHQRLIPLINRAIISITGKQHQQIKNSWFQAEFKRELNWAEVSRIVAWTVAFLLPIILVTLIWNRRLNAARRRLQQSQNELAIARDKAQQASEFKSQFMANMSHEIRTPMNAIMGMNHLLMHSGLNERQKDYAHKIKQAAAGLLGVINDVLDFSKVEAGRLEILHQPFNLNTVFTELADMMAVRAADKGIEVIIDVDPEIPDQLLGDALRLGQVLTNLTQNAIKFTSQGEVRVVARHQQVSSQSIQLQLRVEDTGIGIAKHKLQYLFEPYVQLDGSITRNYGGTGLGLSISRQLVELMGGDIQVYSEKGKGSCFIVTLELEINQAETQHQHFANAGQLAGLRVLVLDDNPTARQVLSEMLCSFGFQVDTLSSGEQALALVQQQDQQGQPYGLVVADWQMPGMDGIAVLKTIAETRLLHQPAKILITAYCREDVIASAERENIETLLIKPINASVLFDAILRLLTPEKAAAKPLITADSLWLSGRVLLVEDNPINQAVALELMHTVGLVADTADNGAEALEAVQQHDYDLVLMDLQMPVMDGLQATTMIRQKGLMDLPIVAMTAHAMEGDKQRCLASGMNDHIPKPIDPDHFFQLLRQWLPEGEPVARDKVVEQQLHNNLNELEGIDIEWGITRVGGNRGLYFKLLSDFYWHHKASLAEAEAAIAQGDYDTARRIVHTLHGVSANLGAHMLEKDAAQLEQQLRTPEQVSNLLQSLSWQRTAQSNEQVFQAIASSGLIIEGDEDAASVDSAQVDLKQSDTEALQQLYQLLQKGDVEATDYLSSIAHILPQDLAVQLKKAVADFDFELAMVQLNQHLAIQKGGSTNG
jgi:polar amino acid transport system substrate-binding protein